MDVMPGKEISVDIQLEQPIMNEVVERTRPGKYRNKDNPAVELIRKVIDNKDKNRMKACDFVLYQQYEKIELSLTNKPEKLLKNKLLKNFVFIPENQDTTKAAGKALVPVYLEETLSDRYYRKKSGDSEC